MNRNLLPLKTAALVLLIAAFAGCGDKSLSPPGSEKSKTDGLPGKEAERVPLEAAEPPGTARSLAAADSAAAPPESGMSLEQIAEIERADSWFPGLALAESGFREEAGDYAGAAVAAFKELARAYGSGAVSGEQVEEGLQNALKLYEGFPPSLGPRRESGLEAVRGCIAFTREDWARAGELLSGVLPADEEPDSFLRWMILVCVMEQEKTGNIKTARSAYGAIRARYKSFPEYWYRGARAFSAIEDASEWDRSAAAAFAEQCIDASPRGPFAAECRKILAGHFGIAPDGSGKQSDVRLDIRSRAEIESIIRASVSAGDPQILEELFPLIALPDNSLTLYALGAMKSLASVSEYKTFFLEGSRNSAGRLGERLLFLARG